MTCIVGVVHEGKVYIGGDSASANNYVVRRSAVPKVFRNGSFVIGYTSSWRMGQILQHQICLESITSPNRESLLGFMVQDFIPVVRGALKDHGYAKRENNEETGGEFLVGYSGHLFHVGSDYQVNETLDGINACGCSEEIALGVLWATSHLQPRERIELALETAAHYGKDVRPPWTIIELTE